MSQVAVCASPIITRPEPIRRLGERYCLPTLADALFVVLLIRILQLGTTGLFNDPGTGWHLRTGDQVASSRAVPRVETYSHTRRGYPWIETQWLGDVVMSQLFRAGGYSLMALTAAVILAGTFRWIYRRHVAAGGWPAVAAVLVFVAACGASGHFLARPLIASTVGVPLCFWWATQYARGEGHGWRLWLLIPLAGVWANIHPGVLGGIATVALCGVGTIIEALLSNRREMYRRRMRCAATLVGVSAAMAAATLANPYGPAWHRWVVGLMSMRGLGAYVEEWMPTAWSRPETVAAAVLAGAIGVGAIVRRGSIRPGEALVVIAWAWQGFQSARHLPLFCLVAALQIGRMQARHSPPGEGTAHSSDSVRRAGCSRSRVVGLVFSPSLRETESQTPGGLASAAVVACLSVMLLAGTRIEAIGLGTARPPEDRYSASAVAFLRSHRPPGPLFNDLDYGGTLIRELPDMPVFIDDRFELYGEEFIGEYRAAVLRPADAADNLLDRWRIRTVLIRTKLPLCGWLSRGRNWFRIYRDPSVAVFVRRVDAQGPEASP